MKTFAFITLLAMIASCAVADQPAVTLTSPDQGSKWKVGSTLTTAITWPNTNTITYSEVRINLISGDPFDSPTTLQTICSIGQCPSITGGVISINWKLAPSIIYFGQATIWVRAKWQSKSSSVIDTLSQSLTILIVCDDGSTPDASGKCPTPTPTRAPTATRTATRTVTPVICPNEKVAGPDGKCPTPTKPPVICPNGKVAGPDGKCPTPTKPAVPTKAPVPSTRICPNGRPVPASGVCEIGSTVCPDLSSFPATGSCASARSNLPCVLTQIGSDDFLCPKNQPFEICCAGSCAYGTGPTHFCCGAGWSCPTGTTCGIVSGACIPIPKKRL